MQCILCTAHASTELISGVLDCLTCSLGLSIMRRISGGMPPASLIAVRLLSSTARFASVLAAISVVMLVGPTSNKDTSFCIAPASRTA